MGVHFHLHTALCRLFGFVWFLLQFARGGGVGVLQEDADVPALRLSTASAAVAGAMRGAKFGRHDICLVVGRGKTQGLPQKLWGKGWSGEVRMAFC